MTAIFAVCNQKGGVGKTTLAVGMAEVYALEQGKKVLIIDADPQRNTTTALGVTEPEFTLNDVLYGDPDNGFRVAPGLAGDAVIEVSPDWQAVRGSISLIASERNLAGRERDDVLARESRLRTALRGVTDAYDVVIIDCPPSLGLLTINALTVATEAVLVTEPRASSFEGVGEIAKTMVEVSENFNENLTVAGIVVNKMRKGRLDQERWMRKLDSEYEGIVVDPALPDREVFSKAHAEAKPLRSFGQPGREALKTLTRVADKLWERAHE